MKLRHRLAVGATAVVMAVGTVVALNPGAVQAHGVAMFPGARTWMCYVDGLRQNGEIIANNPACAAAQAQTGTTPLYNWFAVLRSDANGRTVNFIPDGAICSGGTGGPFDFTAYNAARTDWPVTHLTSGSTVQYRYSNWARHPGTFQLYITRDGWSPTTPLAWADLVPFASVTNPPDTGGPGAFNYYFWDVTLPVRTGRHIIYVQWVRSDSQENFFSCSDVVFDGGNGQVTGVGPNQTAAIPFPTSAPLGSGTAAPPTTSVPSTTAGPPTSAPPTTSRPPSTSSAPPTTTRPPTTGSPGTGPCTATYSVASAWSTGFQGGVTVTNNTAGALNGWTVTLTFANGQTVTQAWNSTVTQTGATATFKPAAWNSSIPAAGNTSFGFLGSSNGTNAVPTATCTSP